MPATIKIEIGHHPFTERKLSSQTVDQIISEVLVSLGIKVDTEIHLSENPDFLTINGYVCRFPKSLSNEIDNYVRYHEKEKGVSSADDLFWKTSISNIIWLQPHVLFPSELVTEYLPGINTHPPEKQQEIQNEFRLIIFELLDLFIFLSDQQRIIDISGKYLQEQVIEWSHLREELIESLSSAEIGIYFNPVYFDQNITSPSRQNYFEMMRDGMFYETGIKYPPFNIHLDDQLSSGAFCFKINSFTTIPIIGLAADQILVNDTPDRLKLLGITGTATVNPANGNPSSFIPASDREKVEANGATTWDSLGYTILAFSGVLRKYGYVFVNKKLSTQYMEQIKTIFPKMIELFGNEKQLPAYVKTLRLLAKEEISIRNFRVIMEAILESDFIEADALKYIIFDERIPLHAKQIPGWHGNSELAAEFVRMRLKRYISHKYSKGQSTLIVYLLDPEIEKMIDAQPDPLQSLDTESISSIHQAVELEMENLPASSQVPVILTSVNARSPMRRIIEAKYPQVAVLSYQELSPDMNIQPIARISL